MTWFDSTTPYAFHMHPSPTSRSVADRLSYKQGVGGSIPPSSTVAEVEVVDTPGRGPGGSRFESGRSPQMSHRNIPCEGSGISEVSYALPAGSIPALATNATPTPGPVA